MRVIAALGPGSTQRALPVLEARRAGPHTLLVAGPSSEMTQSKVVRYVSGDWNAALGQIRLRLEAEPTGEPVSSRLYFGPAH